MNATSPPHRHLRSALNLPGRSEGEGGRGNPPVDAERSQPPDFPPTDSAEEPGKKELAITLFTYIYIIITAVEVY